MDTSKRATIYFDAAVHQALRSPQGCCDRPLDLGMVNEAVRVALAEDAEDLAAFDKSAKANEAFRSSRSFAP